MFMSDRPRSFEFPPVVETMVSPVIRTRVCPVTITEMSRSSGAAD
jgi:hypothetical protein